MDLFISAIIFSILMARDMSPLIFSFPDMKAMVGFNFPVNTHTHTHQALGALRKGEGPFYNSVIVYIAVIISTLQHL